MLSFIRTSLRLVMFTIFVFGFTLALYMSSPHSVVSEPTIVFVPLHVNKTVPTLAEQQAGRCDTVSEGALLIVDEQGRVCERFHLDERTRCCRADAAQKPCHTCFIDGPLVCCRHREQCIGCCMHFLDERVASLYNCSRAYCPAGNHCFHGGDRLVVVPSKQPLASAAPTADGDSDVELLDL